MVHAVLRAVRSGVAPGGAVEHAAILATALGIVLADLAFPNAPDALVSDSGYVIGLAVARQRALRLALEKASCAGSA